MMLPPACFVVQYNNETWSKKTFDICHFWRSCGHNIGAVYEMKRVFALMCVLAALFCSACAPTPVSTETYAMNTICTQTLYADEAVAQANNASINELERLLSKTIEGSDLWRLNHEGRANVSQDTANVLTRSLELAEKTGGAFDPAIGALMDAWGFGTGAERVPTAEEIAVLLQNPSYEAVSMDGNSVDAGGAEIDLGGSAKGYALDALRQNMETEGVSAGLVSLGGSIYARGKKPDGSAWRVGIRDPLGSEADYVATLELVDECISTSGAYERGFEADGKYYHHIIDPKTGYPAQSGLLSVSVVGERGVDTDIYSTALFVMGLERGKAFAEQNGVDAVFITEDKQIITTAGFGRGFTVKDSAYEAG